MESLDSEFHPRGTTKSTTAQQQQAVVDAWNATHDTGLPVWYWKGDRSGERRAGVTTHAATLMGGHTPAVKLDGEALMALTHVDPVDLDNAAAVEEHESALREELHWRDILAARKQLNESIGEAQTALRYASTMLDELCGPLYDVEFAEGGQSINDIRHFLDEARRATRVLATLNTAFQSKF